MILVDSSVWVAHLRIANERLQALLEEGEVLTHPFVMGELACGNLRNRAEILRSLRQLPFAPIATDIEALSYIESQRLMGRGIGYIDVHLLASAALAEGVRIWTLDARLTAAAACGFMAYEPTS